MANSYAIGTQVQVSVTFTVAGVASDPTVVTAKVKDPAGVVSTLSTIRDAQGVYHALFVTALPGVHYYRFTGTGAVVVAGENAFVVLPSSVL